MLIINRRWLWIFFISITGCSSGSEAFRSSYSDEYKLRGYQASDIKVTGSACAFDPQQAVIDAKNTAQYNLRSLLGNDHYHAIFRERKRTTEGKQTCVEIMATVRKNNRSSQ
ncbi:MAG: hypothetical protein HQM12_12885 [SAR324 cluster bacterium]|nr:hypothetical protein [SAR324 cluster bacterium]